MATVHDDLDVQSLVSAVTYRSSAVRSGAMDDKNGMATLHNVFDVQWIYDNQRDDPRYHLFPRVCPHWPQACGREGQRRQRRQRRLL
jgi:hypothetical protein